MSLESQLIKSVEINKLIENKEKYSLIVDKFFIYADEVISDLNKGIKYNRTQYKFIQEEVSRYLK
jgi:hypothetical protein